MADENGGGVSDIEMLIFVFGGFAVLVALWFWVGGPKHADLRGIFLNPPAPINNGNAYGPEIKPLYNGQTPTTTHY
jgi:hypothetical protein